MLIFSVHPRVLFLLIISVLTSGFLQAQILLEEPDLIYSFNFSAAKTALNSEIAEVSIWMPLYSGEQALVTLKPMKISDNQPSEIKTFNGKTSKGNFPLKFTFTPSGISGVYRDLEGYVYFESTDKTNEKIHLYRAKDVSHLGDAVCGLFEDTEVKNVLRGSKMSSESPFPVGSNLRTYRMAAAAAAEMYVALGSKTAVRNKIVAIINASNLIYELETAITFTLIDETIGSMSIIFTDTTTDYYANPETFASAGKSQNAFNEMATDNILIKSKYDVGHTFNIVQSVCYICGQAGPDPCSDASKATGMTQFYESAPVGSIAGLFVHEVGHQFRAWHTFNARGGSSASPTFCTGGWSNTAAVEPGSGSTLMGYGGNCSYPVNYVLTSPNNEDYFHVKSLEQIFQSLSGTAGTCFSSSATENIPPVSNAGADYIIPNGTPFVLTGSATDANTTLGQLTYTWEQMDVASANDQGALGSSINGVGGYSAVNSTTAPLFRSKLPSSSLSRTFPAMAFILNNANNPDDNEGEDLPQVARSMNFRFTTRDNEAGGGGVDSEAMLISVVNNGPFQVTVGNSSTLWSQGETKAITWDVNNTNQAPVNCANVKISISYDGGTSFSTLIASTANDGTEDIIVPNVISDQVRIKIEAIGNIFFDINNANITITDGTCVAINSSFTPLGSVNETEGSANLNFSFTSYGTDISGFSGSIESSDPASNLSFDNEGSCNGPSNSNKYDSYKFFVKDNGAYEFTFSTPNPGLVMNLYSGEYDKSNVCNNWLASSAKKTSASVYVNITNTLNLNLSPGNYELVVSSFSNSTPSSLPAAYSINVSQGTIYDILPEASSPYVYAYVVENRGTGLIDGFDTDLRGYSSGSFKIHGLSYPGGADLNSYQNTSFSSFQNDLGDDTFCGVLSLNSKSVQIGECPSIPDAPEISPVTIFSGNSVTLSATGCSDEVNWYNDNLKEELLATGENYTTAILQETKKYFVSCKAVCESILTDVEVTVIAYCSVQANCTDDDIITNVKITQESTEVMNSSSSCSNENGYFFYNENSISLIKGQSYQIEVTKSIAYNEGLGAWIDYNRDGVFEEYEFVINKNANTSATQNAIFNIPLEALSGLTRMRVKIDYGIKTTDPCVYSSEFGNFGEVEDYLIEIVAAPSPCEASLTLISPSDNIESGIHTFERSDNISATNLLSGGNTTLDAGGSVVLNPGFFVGDGAVLTAKIGGCTND